MDERSVSVTSALIGTTTNYDVKYKPNNCGYHEQWRFPDNFAPCGDNCQGAFCRCLPKYNYYNHNLDNRDVKKGKKKK